MNSTNKITTSTDREMAFLCIGLIEATIGFFGILLADIPGAFNVVTVFGGILGLGTLGYCILNPKSIKTYDLLGAILLFAYATGALNSLIRYSIAGNDLTLHSFVSNYWLARTLGTCIAATGLLHLIGRLDADGYIFSKTEILDFEQKKLSWGLGCFTLLILTLIATGKLGFMANVLSDKGSMQISIIASLALDLITPAGAISIFLAIKVNNKNYKYYFFGIALILLFIQFGLGRRIFLFTIFTYAMSALLAERPKKIFSLRYFFVAILLVGSVQVATTAFYTLRIANFSFKYNATAPSIVDLVPEAYNVYLNREKIFLDEQLKENLSSRTFILEYLADLNSRANKIDPMYGTNLLRALIVTTPSILYPRKFLNPLFATEEEIANPHFYLPIWDGANTVFTAGIIDFGEIGLFILPAIFALVFSTSIKILRKFLSPIATLILSFFIAKILFSVETDITGYLSSMRTLVIFTIALYFYTAHRKKIRLGDQRFKKKELTP